MYKNIQNYAVKAKCGTVHSQSDVENSKLVQLQLSLERQHNEKEAPPARYSPNQMKWSSAGSVSNARTSQPPRADNNAQG